MQTKDIEVGGTYAIEEYGRVAKVKVTAKGLLSPRHGRATFDGVEFEILDSSPGFRERRSCKSRRIEPWLDTHADHIADHKRHKKAEERMERIGNRLDIIVQYHSPNRVVLFADNFIELAERLGVETD